MLLLETVVYSFFYLWQSCNQVILFFLTQKTAYEWRISDWSSDVCSSDLGQAVDLDAVLPAGDRPALQRSAPDAERAGLGGERGGDLLGHGHVGQGRHRVRRPALLHEDRGDPRVVGPGRHQRADGVGEGLAGGVVDVGLQEHHGMAGSERCDGWAEDQQSVV